MLAFALAAFLAQSSSDFTISDTTDNETGVRTVYALQIDVDELQRPNFMKLECIEHRPTVVFEFYDFNAPEWVVVTLGGGDSADTPLIFKRDPDREDKLHLYGDANVLIGLIGEGSIRRFTVHTSSGDRGASYAMSGLRKTWQRVSAACR